MKTVHRRTLAATAALTAALSLTALGTASAAPSAKAATAACTSATTKVTVVKVERPINHLLLKAKNTGTKACNAYNAPYLRFAEAQAPTPWVEDSKPQAVITLQPGQTAYAGIGTSSPEGTDGYTAHKLGALFADRAGNGGVGSMTDVKLPREGVYVDTSAFVTYWQSSAADALTW